MKVLVTYASRHGATAGIAERIAAGLRSAGLPTDLSPVTDVDDVTAYDAFVIGGAAYMFHWLKDATAFVKRHRARLADRPVWLFSSGPLGTDLVDKEGRDVLETGRQRSSTTSSTCSGHGPSGSSSEPGTRRRRRWG
jgi:menaquinone-dependent protoporphyrinogen oxidase